MPAPVMQTKLPIGQTTGQPVAVNLEEKIVVPPTERKPMWTAQGYQGKVEKKPVEEQKIAATTAPVKEGSGIILPPGAKTIFGPAKENPIEATWKPEKPNPVQVEQNQKIKQFSGLFEGISKQEESDSSSSEDSEDSDDKKKSKKKKP